MENSTNYCKELVDRYSVFYRAKNKGGRKPYTSTAVVKPVKIASDVLIKQTTLTDDELKDSISALLYKFSEQCLAGTSEGICLIQNRLELRQAIEEFSRFFVDELFVNALNKDRSRISGNKFALIEHTCEFLYLKEFDKKGD